MHSNARLLIFTPTWIDEATQEDAIAPECEAAIKSQVGVEFDWHVTADNPYPIGDLRNVLHQYQQAREYFLIGKWEALLTIEHDNVLPDSGAVQRLVDTPGDVVYAPYLLRHGNPVLNVLQYINDNNLGQSLSGDRDELARARRKVVYRVSGTGMGCTLFRRAAIEAIPFEATGPHCAAPDMSFSRAALRKRLIMVGRFDVPVLHLSGGRWLHPYRNEGMTMKYLALQTANIMVNSNAVKLTQGEEIDLDPAEALGWLRSGYLKPISVPPAPEPEPEPTPDEIEAAVIEPSEMADAPAQSKRRKGRKQSAESSDREW